MTPRSLLSERYHGPRAGGEHAIRASDAAAIERFAPSRPSAAAAGHQRHAAAMNGPRAPSRRHDGPRRGVFRSKVL
jgi:hypothetical protein